MSLVQEFDSKKLANADRPAQLFGFCSAIAGKLDELNKRTEKVRRESPGAPALKPDGFPSWSGALNSANGFGDLQLRLQAMAANIDTQTEWLEDLGLVGGEGPKAA